jgi:glutathione S-transferase
MAVWHTLSYDNHAFRVYITWGGLLLIKLLCMAFLTSFQRLRKGAVENPEDVTVRSNMEIKKDEDVERVRRAHLNDLENIPAFLFAALM